jgi:nicotinate-nucleotide adenylyltransferase
MTNLNRERVLIYGGGFNPPTLTHQEVMRQALGLPGFNEVWVMPCGNRLDKKFSVSDETRIEMLELVKQEEFDSDPRLHISDFELNLPRPTQTAITVGALATAYSEIDFSFIFGVDSYNHMPTWKNGKQLQAELDMFIVNRGDEELPARNGIFHLEVEDLGISSTLVRELVGLELQIEHMVCPAIDKYVKEYGLYRVNENQIL